LGVGPAMLGQALPNRLNRNLNASHAHQNDIKNGSDLMESDRESINFTSARAGSVWPPPVPRKLPGSSVARSALPWPDAAAKLPRDFPGHKPPANAHTPAAGGAKFRKHRCVRLHSFQNRRSRRPLAAGSAYPSQISVRALRGRFGARRKPIATPPGP